MAYIYKTTNLINGKIYIGKSLRDDPGYYGSGLLITAAIEKYGKENFSKSIIEECDESIINDREIYWIGALNARDLEIGYNLSIGGTGGNHYWKTLDEDGKKNFCQKLKDAKVGEIRDYSDDQRKKVKAGLANFWNDKKNDKEWLANRGDSKSKKYILSDEHEFVRIKNLGKYAKENSLDNCWLISIATGNKFTPCKGYYCVFDTGQSDKDVLEQIRAIKHEQQLILDAWLEKTRNREKYECKFCKKMVTKSNLIRWHNDKCKENGENNTTNI